MCPQTHRASNCSVAFSLPCLYKQEAGTKTTVPSPPAFTQALGRTGSVHTGESHSLVDYLVSVLVPLNSTRGAGERFKNSRKTLSLTMVSSLLVDKSVTREMETTLAQHLEANISN